MKGKRTTIVISAAVIVAVVFLLQLNKGKKPVAEEASLSAEKSAASSVDYKAQIKNSLLKIPDNTLLADIKGLKEEEKKSLLTLTSVMAETMNSRETYDQFTARLEELKLAPKALNDQNPYTGKMTIVRTALTLPGTRYIHAQYFSGENEKPGILQHLSFELRGSVDSMKAARKTIEQQFGLKEKPETDTPGFIAWHVKGKSIWIKKLTTDDMKNDPYNSYDPETDVGTIRIAVESEIH